MEKFKNLLWIVALIVVVALIGVVSFGYYKKSTYNVQNPVATMEVENFGTVKMELDPQQAPETVANFIKLANNGYYNGTTFHRIIKDFMIQGGTKEGDGENDATKGDLEGSDSTDKYTITGEFLANKKENTIKFVEGTLAMARADYTSYAPTLTSESYNSGCSQFFIMTKENTNLNGYYAGFGKVIEGMDVVHKIEEVEVTTGEESEGGEQTSSNAEASKPVNPPKITSISVDTFGVDYGEPTTLEPFDYMSWMYKQYGINQ